MLRLTLLTDGSSDRALLRIVEWALSNNGVRTDLLPNWADLRFLRQKPTSLSEKISKAVENYPCDILFVHRDAEGEEAQKRIEEIANAVAESESDTPYACVVPVRMQEAWLLLDENAIRLAAGNPNGAMDLELPPVDRLELISDPKEVVFDLLRQASGLHGRRLHRFDANTARSLICEQMTDYSQLRSLPSFRAFETEVQALIASQHLDTWV